MCCIQAPRIKKHCQQMIVFACNHFTQTSWSPYLLMKNAIHVFPCTLFHNSNVTCASRRPKLPTSWLFVQQIVRDYSKKTIRALHVGRLWETSNWDPWCPSQMDSKAGTSSWPKSASMDLFQAVSKLVIYAVFVPWERKGRYILGNG